MKIPPGPKHSPKVKRETNIGKPSKKATPKPKKSGKKHNPGKHSY